MVGILINPLISLGHQLLRKSFILQNCNRLTITLPVTLYALKDPALTEWFLDRGANLMLPVVGTVLHYHGQSGKHPFLVYKCSSIEVGRLSMANYCIMLQNGSYLTAVTLWNIF